MNSQHPHLESSEQERSQNQGVARIIEKNIDSIVKVRLAAEGKKGFQAQIADVLTRFSGSMFFVYVHALWFGVWIALNVRWLGRTPFDPFPFSLLTLIVSLEAIFLSTFVLISQNHATAVADRRAELDLQINLLSEHEITHLLVVMDAVAEHLGVELKKKPEVEELKRDVHLGRVVDTIESRQNLEQQKG